MIKMAAISTVCCFACNFGEQITVLQQCTHTTSYLSIHITSVFGCTMDS